MEPLDENPEIGPISIDPGSLEREGIELDELIPHLHLEESGDRPADTPSRGWRVLTTNEGAVEAIGAPADGDGRSWRLGQIVRARADSATARLSLHPASFPIRPSRKDRAGGLALRWPNVTLSEPDIDRLAIDIVNSQEERWYPQGDSFAVFAALCRAGDPAAGVSFGYVAGQSPALALDHGEYARVRVIIDTNQWDDIEPGPYEIRPILIDLGLHGADPLKIELTEEDIRLHQRPKPRRASRPAEGG